MPFCDEQSVVVNKADVYFDGVDVYAVQIPSRGLYCTPYGVADGKCGPTDDIAEVIFATRRSAQYVRSRQRQKDGDILKMVKFWSHLGGKEFRFYERFRNKLSVATKIDYAQTNNVFEHLGEPKFTMFNFDLATGSYYDFHGSHFFASDAAINEVKHIMNIGYRCNRCNHNNPTGVLTQKVNR